MPRSYILADTAFGDGSEQKEFEFENQWYGAAAQMMVDQPGQAVDIVRLKHESAMDGLAGYDRALEEAGVFDADTVIAHGKAAGIYAACFSEHDSDQVSANRVALVAPWYLKRGGPKNGLFYGESLNERRFSSIGRLVMVRSGDMGVSFDRSASRMKAELGGSLDVLDLGAEYSNFFFRDPAVARKASSEILMAAGVVCDQVADSSGKVISITRAGGVRRTASDQFGRVALLDGAR